MEAQATIRPEGDGITRDRVLTVVAQAYDVSARKLTGRRRGSAEVAQARQIAIYLARMVLKLSYTDLGAAFGRHRSTAQHAVRRVEEQRDDPKVDQTLSWLEQVLRTPAEVAQ